MIRSFAWRDLPLLYRMRRRMLILDSHRACIASPPMLHDILLNAPIFRNYYCALVSDTGGGAAGQQFGRFHHRPGYRHAQLCFIGPVEQLDEEHGNLLLEALIAAAGERGAHMLIAEADEQSVGFLPLRNAGFIIYARQRIWKAGAITTPSAQTSIWRTAVPEDIPAMQNLYLNLVPPMVQQVEPGPFTNHHFWVNWSGQELNGILEVVQGPTGIRLQPYFHPAVRTIDDLLIGFLRQYRPLPGSDVYVCVRSYQGGFAAPLLALGFVPWSDQAVMGRRLTAMVQQGVHAGMPLIDGAQAEISAPMTHMDTQG
ncbi:MAG: hypothetical protein JXA97_03715 [Anaerolineales bacterium]|nr:hypothetical protein [Anaerolineales bacterium]